MATRNRLQSYNFYPAATALTASTINSLPVYILNLDNIGLQLNVSGTPNGVFTVQVSIDYNEDAEGNILNAGNWPTLLQPDGTPVAQSITAGSPNEVYFDINQISSPWIRIQYVGSSGSGAVSGFASGKMI